MTTKDWLTPETAIGATLPCGAKVVQTYPRNNNVGGALVFFDKPPANFLDSCGGFEYNTDGTHAFYTLLALTPASPTPAPSGVMVTREILRAALNNDALADTIAAALGIPPDPPKIAPWEATYEAWRTVEAGPRHTRDVWQAAVEWCVGQVNTTRKEAGGIADNGEAAAFEDACVSALRRIMGEA